MLGQDDPPPSEVASPWQIWWPDCRDSQDSGALWVPGFSPHPVQALFVSKASGWVQPFQIPIHTGPGWGGPRPPPLDLGASFICACVQDAGWGCGAMSVPSAETVAPSPSVRGSLQMVQVGPLLLESPKSFLSF